MIDHATDFERNLSAERRQKIAGFIQDTLALARKTIDENEVISKVIENFEARDYQTEAWSSIWQAREQGETHGLVHLATGLGKTSVGVFDYAKFRKERLEHGEPARALFVVHQNNILEQANERFGELLPETSRSYFSNQQKVLPNTDITFASFQALYNGSRKFPRDYFDYIIYDEAHHIEASSYKTVVDYFQPAFQLGLTATPVRMDEKDITEHFGKPLYSKTLPEAIAEGHLATVNYNIVFDDAVKEAIDKGFDPISMAEIQRLFDVEPRNEEIVKTIQDTQKAIRDELGFQQVKTIVFCADLEHANDIADLLDGTSYHSQKSKQEQDRILTSFRSNGIETITVRDMFNEGVDIPDARLIVFLRSTSSGTIFEQQLGRGLRKNKDKQEVTILDFVANIERIAKIRELAENISTNSDESKGIKGEQPNDTDNIISDHEEGIKIHGDFSQFIFSQEIIDLLEKYGHLSEKPDLAPIHYEYLGSLANRFGRARRTVQQVAESLEITGATHLGRTTGHVGLYYSPNEVSQIEDVLKSLVYAPEGWNNLLMLKNKYGINPYTTTSIAEDLAIESIKMLTDSGSIGYYFSPEQTRSILCMFEQRNDNRQKEGWHTMTTIANESSTSQPSIAKIIEEQALEGTTAISKQGKEVIVYSPDQQIIIQAEVDKMVSEKAPIGWLSAPKIGMDYGGFKPHEVRKAIKSLQLSGTKFRGNDMKWATFYSPDDISRIADKIQEGSDLESAPENYVSLKHVCIELKTSDITLLKAIENLSIDIEYFRSEFSSRPTRYLNQNDVNRLREHFSMSSIEAPEGYIAIRHLASKLNVAESTVKRAAKTLGIELHKMHSGGKKVPGFFFSPEEISKIESEIFIREQPQGYMIAGEIASEFNVSKETIINWTKKLNIHAQIMRSKSSARKIKCYSPEQIQLLSDYQSSLA